MTIWEAQDWMARFRVERPRDLASRRETLVRCAVRTGGRGTRAAIVAFLDRAQDARDGAPWDRGMDADLARALGTAFADARDRSTSDPVHEPWHVEVLYGCFFGSGDPEDLARLVHPDPAWSDELRRHVDRSLLFLGDRYPWVAEAVRGAGRFDLFPPLARRPSKGTRPSSDS